MLQNQTAKSFNENMVNKMTTNKTAWPTMRLLTATTLPRGGKQTESTDDCAYQHSLPPVLPLPKGVRRLRFVYAVLF